MRRLVPSILLTLAATLAVVVAQQTVQIPDRSPVQPQPGQRSRPGDGREPEWPAPRITEYKPRTTLVTAQHPTPRAKYPSSTSTATSRTRSRPPSSPA